MPPGSGCFTSRTRGSRDSRAASAAATVDDACDDAFDDGDAFVDAAFDAAFDDGDAGAGAFVDDFGADAFCFGAFFVPIRPPLYAEDSMNATFKIAGTVDSWCGRCKLLLVHTIETLEGTKPNRVHCNTCGSQHAYKPYLPGEAPRQVRARERAEEDGPRAPQPGKVKASHYDELMKGRDTSKATAYSPKSKYTAGDLVTHPNFGLGVAIALKDSTKIEILFAEGPKVLIHGR
jgi:hypothetical protein